MKNKEGRRTSHSYWSWTHGPRETTHNSLGRRPWWWRSSRWWFSPPAGCREEFSWCSRSWKHGGGGTEARSGKRVPSSRVSGREQYICKRGSPEAEVGPQAPPWRGQGWGRAGWPPGPPQPPLWPCLGFFGSSRYADFSCIFPGIFRALLIWGKPEIEQQQKTGTGTVVH